MRPILFFWRGVGIKSYPVMLYLGLNFGLLAGNHAANHAGLNSSRVFAATILLLVPALAGARLFFMAAHRHCYPRIPRQILGHSQGGAALYGGLMLSLPLSVPLLRGLQVPFGAFWDVATFVALVGMIFARTGCLLHGCCAGRPSPGRVALCLPNHRGIWRRRIPTQLLEAGWAALLLFGAVLLWNRMPFSGGVFLCALAGYGSGRFLLEWTREEQHRIGGLPVQGIISATLVVFSVAVFLVPLLR